MSSPERVLLSRTKALEKNKIRDENYRIDHCVLKIKENKNHGLLRWMVNIQHKVRRREQDLLIIVSCVMMMK